MNHYDKARFMGLDERTIDLAQMAFPHGLSPLTVTIHEALDKVLLHAMAYDHPGQPVYSQWLIDNNGNYLMGLVPHDYVPH